MSRATQLAAFLTRSIEALVAEAPAVITIGATPYDVRLDAGPLTRDLEMGGPVPAREIEILVPDTEALTPALGRELTVTTTVTGGLQGLVFTITGIEAHPNLPATLLTARMRP